MSYGHAPDLDGVHDTPGATSGGDRPAAAA